MGLVKRTYVDGETVITADNLNDIQDEIIQNALDISTKGTYSKPSGGIPSTDLASAVQTSLGKADTALQSSDIDSTLTVVGKAADAKKTGDEISGIKNTLTQLGNDVTALDGRLDTAEGNINSLPDTVRLSLRRNYVYCSSNTEIVNTIRNQIALMGNAQLSVIALNIYVDGLKLPGGVWTGLLSKADADYYSCTFFSYNSSIYLYKYFAGTESWYYFQGTAF